MQVVVPLVTDGSPSRLPFLPPSAAVWDVNGRGNNWAWGYTNASSRLGAVNGTSVVTRKKGGSASLLDRSLNAVRKHVSAIDLT